MEKNYIVVVLQYFLKELVLLTAKKTKKRATARIEPYLQKFEGNFFLLDGVRTYTYTTVSCSVRSQRRNLFKIPSNHGDFFISIAEILQPRFPPLSGLSPADHR